MSSAKGSEKDYAIGKTEASQAMATSNKHSGNEANKLGQTGSSDLSGLLGCKKVLDNSMLDNQTKLIKLVTDHELGQTIKHILAEGEVTVTYPERLGELCPTTDCRNHFTGTIRLRAGQRRHPRSRSHSSRSSESTEPSRRSQ